MLIQVHTDDNIEGADALAGKVQASVNSTLERFSDQITRISVHLSDQNSDSKGGGADMRCQIEARLAGLQPLSVTDNAENLDKAVNGAVKKMMRALETALGKRNTR
jgi:ribosome-associated translation inhibitor RaiA